MKNAVFTLLCAVLLICSNSANAQRHRGSSGRSHPNYGGGHHTTSHGGRYPGGHGSSHRDGTYHNSRTNNTYGRHRK